MAGNRTLTAQQEVVILRQEVRRLRIQGFLNNLSKIIGALIRYGAYVLIAYCFRSPLEQYAGKTTHADISINANASANANAKAEGFSLGSCELTALLAIAFGLGGIGYGTSQRKLRKSVVERFHPYQEENERKRDPKRSSSKLTSSGDTRPEDE